MAIYRTLPIDSILFQLSHCLPKGAYPLGDSGAIACTIAGMIGGAVAGRSGITADRTSRRLVGMVLGAGDGRLSRRRLCTDRRSSPVAGQLQESNTFDFSTPIEAGD